MNPSGSSCSSWRRRWPGGRRFKPRPNSRSAVPHTFRVLLPLKKYVDTLEYRRVRSGQFASFKTQLRSPLTNSLRQGPFPRSVSVPRNWQSQTRVSEGLLLQRRTNENFTLRHFSFLVAQCSRAGTTCAVRRLQQQVHRSRKVGAKPVWLGDQVAALTERVNTR